MQRCLTLAQLGAGRVSPNPMVGSVVVSEKGEVLGEGWHRHYGGPHAEREAIADALARHPEEALRTSTLYVNLEPCSHYGKTPPCADSIIQCGIPHVVAGMTDPFPQVSGRGFAKLREAGVNVTVGVLEQQSYRLNEAFIRHTLTGRPLVVLKQALTLDGRVAAPGGDSRWVSGTAARRLVHQWRSWLDGVMVGSGTAAADDPSLTVRDAEGQNPVRIVLDRNGKLPEQLKLFSDGNASNTIAVCSPDAMPVYQRRLEDAGGRLWRISPSDGHLDLDELLLELGRRGGPDGRPMQSVLVEAGPGLASALLSRNLADRYYAFIAPRVLGDGVPVLQFAGISTMAEALTFPEHAWEIVGDDLLFRGYRNRDQARLSRISGSSHSKA